MTLSIWRYSHLSLAISSFLFIIIASLTGIILAFEPISNQLKPYSISDLSSISVAEMIVSLKDEYEEIITVEISNDHFVTASVITKKGDSKIFYINPRTGKTIGEIKEKPRVFKFATNLHRSLFLKSIGRFFVGLVSFLLFLITISGIVLILKRQGGIKKFFNKVTQDSFYQYFHIILGRLALLPLLIITLTGGYLSVEKFNLLPKRTIKHEINFNQLASNSVQGITDFPVFQQIKLSDLKKIEFPFSSDVEDYFLLQLINKEVIVNQITGNVISEVEYPFTKWVSFYSLLLHTGQGSVFWAIILGVTSIGTLFFIYSGFIMTFQRIRGNTKNHYKKEDCEYVILIGSENGNTKLFAKMLFKALLLAKKKVFISDLNSYTSFEKMRCLLVLTATYGNGEAPANASGFLKLIKNNTINNNPFSFAVLAFGSLSYPKYCQFGVEVQKVLEKQQYAEALLPICKINNKSFEAFYKWLQEFNKKELLSLKVDKGIVSKQKKTISLTVKSKKIVTESTDDTFLLRFDNCNKKFTSGDLLGIYPNDSTYERLYSIAKVDRSLVLSIKKHDLGVCSNYLFNIKEGGTINAFVQKNKAFYFPNKASKVIMIATGTGVAPFLGMIYEENPVPIELYFGVKNKKSLLLYKDVLRKENIDKMHIAFSRETSKKIYVQDIVKENIGAIISDLNIGAVIMICGSIVMQNEIFKILEEGLLLNNTSLSYFKKKNQILVDCY